MRRRFRIGIGLVISAVFLYLAFRGQNLRDIGSALRSTDIRWIIPALALYFLGVWVRAMRWRVLLRPIAPTATSRALFPIVVIGFMANNVLPLRAGEIVRSVLVGRAWGVRKTGVLASIVVERIFDGLTMLAFLALSTFFVSLTAELRHLAIISFIVFAGLLIGFLLLSFGSDFVLRMLQLLLRPFPDSISAHLEDLLQAFVAGIGALRDRGSLAMVTITSIIVWLLESAMYYLLAIGFGGNIRQVMDVPVALLTTGVANLSTLIPGAPGYIGQFEYGIKLVLNGAFGTPESEALAYAILVHAALYFPITIWGLLGWFRRSLTVEDLTTEPVDMKR